MESEKEVKELETTLKKAGKFKPIESPVRKFWTAKDGTKLSYRQFMDKWKEGMKGVTQYQQVAMQLRSTYIMLIGLACGFVITLFNFKNLWWLSLILGAGFFNTGISALGLWQRKIALGEIEKMLKEDTKGVKTNDLF